MKILIGIILSVITIGAVAYWGASVLAATNGFELSIHGKIAMALGVVFTFAVGAGLMALLFYSNKGGHDEAVYHLTDDQDDGTPSA